MNTYEVIFKISYIVNANNKEEAILEAQNQFDCDTHVEIDEEEVFLL